MVEGSFCIRVVRVRVSVTPILNFNNIVINLIDNSKNNRDMKDLINYFNKMKFSFNLENQFKQLKI